MDIKKVKGLQTFFSVQDRELDLLDKDALWLKKLIRQMEHSAKDTDNERMASESAAFQIQRLYTGMEEFLKSVLGKFEAVPTGESSHSDLLKASVVAGDHRPALLDETTFKLMDELKSFRHFARHNYGSHLKPGRIREIAETTLKCLDSFKHQWGVFKQKIFSPDEAAKDIPAP